MSPKWKYRITRIWEVEADGPQEALDVSKNWQHASTDVRRLEPTASWAEELANEAERGYDVDQAGPNRIQRHCPDDGACHHQCARGCYRVAYAGPLSNVYPFDIWPPEVVRAEQAKEPT